MFWVHCNRCGLFMEDAMASMSNNSGRGFAFFLTNCGHIFCSGCLNPELKSKCHVCSALEVRSIKLESGMKPEVKSAFSDLGAMSKSLSKTLDFQQSQLKVVMAIFRRNMAALGNQLRLMSQESTMLKKQLMEANTKLRIVETENEKLKAALKSPRPSPHLVLNSNGKPANAGFLSHSSRLKSRERALQNLWHRPLRSIFT